jgi:hypothetical protein
VLLYCLHVVYTGPSGAGESGNKYEAALYGALCGDVRAMLPTCDSWEDEAWAYCRCGVMMLISSLGMRWQNEQGRGAGLRLSSITAIMRA